VLAGAITLVLLAGCGTSATAPGTNGAARATSTVGTTAPRPDFAGQVDLGNGRSIYLECRGSGSPTVVLVSGLGERADDWMRWNDPTQPDKAVFPRVATFTRVCAYDRPGTTTATETGWELSRSTPVPQLATVRDSAVDLNALLSAAGEPGLLGAGRPGSRTGRTHPQKLTEPVIIRRGAGGAAKLEAVEA
jgi:pimeloyl-ACP methyl ester carboxylesterase